MKKKRSPNTSTRSRSLPVPIETVPAASTFAVPGAPGIFHALWLFTFFIHLLCVNSVLGGSLLGALSLAAGDRRWKVAELFVSINSWAISLAITFGVAPLLFVQLLYGRFFYSATVLVAWFWLSMLVMLAAGYYLNYVAKFRFAAGKTADLAVWGAAALFLGVTAVQVAVSLLNLWPERWAAVATNPLMAFRGKEFGPRLVHFVLAALIFAGLVLAWLSVRRPPEKGDEQPFRDRATFGMRVALVAALFQIGDGLWMLGAMPRQALRLWMRQGILGVIPLLLGIVFSFVLIAFLVAAQDASSHPKRVRHSLEVFGATMLVMVLMRHHLRDVYHDAAKMSQPVVANDEWGGALMFLGAFVLCVGLAVYAVVRAVKDRPADGEKTA
jgi:hypothetical protein